MIPPDNSTYTDANDPPPLTLETLIQAIREVEALLPEMLYCISEYAPLTNKGDPVLAAMPELDTNSSEWPTPKTGRYIIFVHPGNLSHLQQKARGKFRLVEWNPKEEHTDYSGCQLPIGIDWRTTLTARPTEDE